MSSILSRKKGTKTVSDETPSQTLTDVEEGSKGNSTSTHTSVITRVINRIRSITLKEFNILLVACVTLMLITLLLAPAHIKRRRNAILNGQMHDISNAIEEQKTSLTKKYELLQNTINGKNDKKIEGLYELVGLVSQLRHEEEVKKKEDKTENIEKDTENEINKRQNELEFLNAELQRHKEELEQVKNDLDSVEVQESNFCNNCLTKSGAKCALRKGYLMKKYNLTEERARTVVARDHVSCYIAPGTS